jgi:RNA polymerase sigma factor (sigma-70 family)
VSYEEAGMGAWTASDAQARLPRGADILPAREAADRRWAALMERAQDADNVAYDRLLREITPFIRAIAARQHGTRDRVEDVVQEVLLTVHRMRHTYDPARPFRPWLAAIARCRSIDALRRRGRSQHFEVAADAAGAAYDNCPDPSSERADTSLISLDRLGPAIAALPRSQREAIELLKLREMSLVEASCVSGASIAALKVNAHRAVKSLRRYFHAD